jgi:hypothetical protein
MEGGTLFVSDMNGQTFFTVRAGSFVTNLDVFLFYFMIKRVVLYRAMLISTVTCPLDPDVVASLVPVTWNVQICPSLLRRTHRGNIRVPAAARTV